MSLRKIAQIRRLYNEATAATIEDDLRRAVEILKTLPDEDTRARAAVFMDGLSQMRSEWRVEQQRRQKKKRRRAQSASKKAR